MQIQSDSHRPVWLYVCLTYPCKLGERPKWNTHSWLGEACYIFLYILMLSLECCHPWIINASGQADQGCTGGCSVQGQDTFSRQVWKVVLIAKHGIKPLTYVISGNICMCQAYMLGVFFQQHLLGFHRRCSSCAATCVSVQPVVAAQTANTFAMQRVALKLMLCYHTWSYVSSNLNNAVAALMQEPACVFSCLA